jgi:hypothetical protein
VGGGQSRRGMTRAAFVQAGSCSDHDGDCASCLQATQAGVLYGDEDCTYCTGDQVSPDLRGSLKRPQRADLRWSHLMCVVSADLRCR